MLALVVPHLTTRCQCLPREAATAQRQQVVQLVMMMFEEQNFPQNVFFFFASIFSPEVFSTFFKKNFAFSPFFSSFIN